MSNRVGSLAVFPNSLMTNPRSLLFYGVNLDNDYKLSLADMYKMVGRNPGVLACRSTTLGMTSGSFVNWSAVHYDYGTHWDANTPANFYINDSYITHVTFNVGIRTTLNSTQRFKIYLNSNTSFIGSMQLSAIDFETVGSTFRKQIVTGPVPVSSGDHFSLQYSFGITTSLQAHGFTYFNMKPWRFA